MDELVKDLERFKDLTSAFTLTDVALVLVLSAVLSLMVGWVYRFTHRGTSYSQSFAQTLVVVSMTTALIMLIIGSNIARAFTLVGALSVIRFRNAVKETRDVTFMFVAMAMGMAVGTRFYLLGAFGCAVLCAVIVLMSKLDVFSKKVTERILRVRMPSTRDADITLEPVFRQHLDDSRLISVETASGGVLQELVYSVVPKRTTTVAALLDAVRTVNDNNKVVLVVGQQEVDL